MLPALCPDSGLEPASSVPPSIPPDVIDLEPLVSGALASGSRVLLEVPRPTGQPDLLMAGLLRGAVAHARRSRESTLVVMADDAALDISTWVYVPLFAGESPDITWTNISRLDDYAGGQRARSSQLILTTYQVLAWNLWLLAETDLELLPLPQCVVLERADEASPRLRRGLARRVTVAGLRRILEAVRLLEGHDLLAIQLDLLITAFDAEVRLGRWNDEANNQLHLGCLPLRGLALLLDSASRSFAARGLQPIGRDHGLTLAARARNAAELMRELLSDLHPVEARLVWEAGAPGLERRPTSIRDLLATGLLDHVRAVVGLASARPSRSDRHHVSAELGMEWREAARTHDFNISPSVDVTPTHSMLAPLHERLRG